MVPIVEIPYSKYLDQADMFFEVVISNWVSGEKIPNGMVIRLQGLIKECLEVIFTIYSLYLPPGLDVVATKWP